MGLQFWPGLIFGSEEYIKFHFKVTDAIENNSLTKCLEEFNGQIKDNVQLVKQGVSKVFGKTLQALIILDLHRKNVLERLVNNQVTVSDDFVWLSNMRYYLVDNPLAAKAAAAGETTKSVEVKMVHTTVEYGFEYLGNARHGAFYHFFPL